MGQLSQKEIERTCKLYQSGMPIKEMAKVLGISRQTVSKRLRDCGIRRAPPRKKEEDAQKEINVLWELYCSGLSRKEMAEKLGVSRGVLDYKLVKYKIVERGKPANKNSPRRESLCWDCKYSAMGDLSPCPWHQKAHIPRDDWKARRNDKLFYGGKVESYFVLDCPGFEKG